MISLKSKIYLAGHKGMVGRAIFKALKSKGFSNILVRTSKELDLREQKSVNDFFAYEKPDIVVNAAAMVGGILANTKYPYQFLMENMQIQNNLIDASVKSNCQKFIFLGSSCIYPKFAPQPLKEEYLLTNTLEATNEWYAIAKISGVKACEAIRKQFGKDYVSLMPTNLYGPHDNFDLETSHVLPAMIRKFHEAKKIQEIKGFDEPVQLWGSGKPKREFMHVDDLAEAVVFAIVNQLPEHLYNIGTGEDLSIKELAEFIQNIIGYKGEIRWDLTKPDGTPRKLLDISKMTQFGWKAQISLTHGVKSTYNWFLENQHSFKEVKV